MTSNREAVASDALSQADSAKRMEAERDECAEALMKVAEAGGWQASAGLYLDIRSLVARAARLSAEVEALRKALEPFAVAAGAYGHSHDESQINERPAWAGKDYVEVRLLAKHLRAARSAIAIQGA